MLPKFSFYFIIALVIIGISVAEESYDSKYDSVDVDEILKSDRLLTSYINCLMDEGPCTEDGKDLKEILPDSIATDCSKCTEKQKESSNKIMHFIIDNRPDDWERLEIKYDEGGKYRSAYMEEKEQENHSNDH